jgi:hypothetical protein
MNKFKEFWSSNPQNYGITGGTDAATGDANAKNLFNLMLNHGSVSRKARGEGPTGGLFFGAGTVWEELEDLVGDRLILEDEVKQFDRLTNLLDRMEGTDKDPRNIVFRTVVSFDGEADPPQAERDEVRGHYMTEAYWNFRKDKAERTGGSYNMPKPKPEWVSLDAAENEAEPPLWRIIFGKKNSLRSLIQEIKELTPPVPPPIAHLDVKINRGKTGRLADITQVQQAVRNVLEMPSIYPAGKSRAPTKSKLNEAMSQQVIATTPEMMRLIGPDSTVLVENDGRIIRRGLDEFPDYEEVKSITLNFPKNNITLNRLIREVLGEEMDSFERPNRPENGPLGLVLKADEADLIQEASSILKNVKLNLRDEDREEDSLLENDPELHNPNILGYTRPDGEEKIRVNLDHILSNAIQEESLENFGMFLRLMRNEGTPEEAKQFADNVDERSYNSLIEVLRHESIHLAQIYGGVSEGAGGGEEYTDLTQAVLLGPMMGNITPQEITHLTMAYFRAFAYHFIYMELPAYWAEGDRTWDEAKEHIKQIWQLQTKFRQTLVNLNEAFLDNYEMPWLQDDTLEDLMRRFNVLFAEIVDAMGDRNAS